MSRTLPMVDYRNFKKHLAELKAAILNMETITRDDWAGLTENQQENFVKLVVMNRNIAQDTAERYFDYD